MDSLKTQLINYLLGKDWTRKSHIEDFARSLGYLADNCGRRLREMTEKGLLEVKFENGQNHYRLIGRTTREARIVPWFSRETAEKLFG